MLLAVKHVVLFLTFCLFSSSLGLLYIDKEVHESISDVINVSFSYTHDVSGNSVSNVTFNTFVTISKMFLYFTVKIADNPKDIGTFRELIKTVIDVEKMLQGSQANPLVKGFFASILRSMKFPLVFPLLPVSLDKVYLKPFWKWFCNQQGAYRLCNVTFDTAFIAILPEFKALMEIRMVGKYGGSKKMRYMSHIAVSGGYRRG